MICKRKVGEKMQRGDFRVFSRSLDGTLTPDQIIPIENLRWVCKDEDIFFAVPDEFRIDGLVIARFIKYQHEHASRPDHLIQLNPSHHSVTVRTEFALAFCEWLKCAAEAVK